MGNELMLLFNDMINKPAVSEIINCNIITLRFGLALSAAEALELIETRAAALRSNGRIEFGAGIINKLIMKFCDSPFLSQHNYAATLHDLIETFYYFKNETLDEISDDELISLMKKYFDQNCQGSIELLQNRELELLARNIRYGVTDYANLCEDAEESIDEENYYD
ncbi:MAG: hypothetical protein CVU89_00315 [Firmicutes bacterium HGW-Firmicutes-14]|jgi:hypothetical protein|nr:MAG: hypothetical protein CVU89_00315 [Firmicutes bacterium HGW-Firmicutes-14]